MLLAKSRRLVAAVAISLCASAGALAAPPTIGDFATQADSIAPSISPDGNMVAFVTRVEGNRVLMVINDGNHSLTRYEWRETLYTNLEKFLAANN